MNYHETNLVNTETYFEEIGAWPHGNGKKSSIVVAYIVGFVLSLVITLGAYYLATTGALPLQTLIISLVALACVQFAVQIAFFLHLSREAAARERLVLLGGTTLIVLILTSGSIWIMQSLNTRMMPTTEQMEQYMDSQAGI